MLHRIILAATLMVSAAGLAKAQDASELVSGTYKADPTHSAIMFVSNHLGLSTFIARFDDYDVTLDYDAENPSNSSLDVTVAPGSVDIDLPLFAEHMSAPAWFDTANHPEASFTSTSFEQTSATEGKVTGDLTLKGVTKPVTLDVKLVGAGMHPMAGVPAFGIEATGTIMRSEFGMTEYVPVIPDEVKLHITVEFHKQEG